MAKFIIAEHVDPHHAHLHYHGATVLKRDGATPVRWIYGNESYDSEQLAREALWDLARTIEAEECDLTHYNDEMITGLKADLLEDGCRESDFDWYRGEGIYYNESGEPMLLRGGGAFSFDVESFSVDELSD